MKKARITTTGKSRPRRRHHVPGPAYEQPVRINAASACRPSIAGASPLTAGSLSFGHSSTTTPQAGRAEERASVPRARRPVGPTPSGAFLAHGVLRKHPWSLQSACSWSASSRAGARSRGARNLHGSFVARTVHGPADRPDEAVVRGRLGPSTQTHLPRARMRASQRKPPRARTAAVRAARRADDHAEKPPSEGAGDGQTDDCARAADNRVDDASRDRGGVSRAVREDDRVRLAPPERSQAEGPPIPTRATFQRRFTSRQYRTGRQ